MTETKTTRTLVKGGWIVAFDGSEHRILENGVVVFEGDEIDISELEQVR